MKKSLVEEFVENPQNMRTYQQERAIVEVTDKIEEALEQIGISRSKFAEMLGKSKGWVTQLLDDEGNKTIRTVADAFAVLGFEYRSFYQPIAISNQSSIRLNPDEANVGKMNISRHPTILSIFSGMSASTNSEQEIIRETA